MNRSITTPLFPLILLPTLDRIRELEDSGLFELEKEDGTRGNTLTHNRSSHSTSRVNHGPSNIKPHSSYNPVLV